MAAVVSSNMMVLTTGSSTGVSQFIPSVFPPCSCSFLTALHIGDPAEGLLCSCISLRFHAFSGLAVNICYLQSKITLSSVYRNSGNSAPHGNMDSAGGMDLACRLRTSRRSTRLPTSLGSYETSLSHSANAWTQATLLALTHSAMTPYVFIKVRSLASGALSFFVYWMWCSLNARCVSIHIPRLRLPCTLNHTDLFLTLIFAVRCGWACFLWPRLHVNSACSVFA
jgi:hypothetical protein